MREHEKSIADVLCELHSRNGGLGIAEAESRLEAHGPNTLESEEKKSLMRKIWEQLRDPMIIVLIAAGILSGVFSELVDMAIILFVVALNTAMGIFQESKAERAIESLGRMSAPQAKVRRGGTVSIIPSSEVVPGDIVLLEAGGSVPADMRLIMCASLKIEEAALTGESAPVEKSTDELTPSETPLGDRVNMAYAGTTVSYGRGEGVVVRTGMATEMGKIADILLSAEDERTPLQQKLAELSRVLSIAVLGICALVFIFGVLRSDGSLFDSFLTATSLAVAAIPEGLVVVVTALLSIGVTKMSAQNAIVRRLTAVETLGCTQIICSDKTGTLTQNRMTVVDHFGEEPLLAEAMALCNDTAVSPGNELTGDPMETALIDYARRLNVRYEAERIGEAPFDSKRKMMSTLHPYGGAVRQYTKGAPDEVLKRCAAAYRSGKIIAVTDELRAEILAESSRMASNALRVLAAAYRDYSEMPGDLSPASLERDMVFIGFAGMIDPVRPEVRAAVEKCADAGMRAIMITGDHRDTAVAIALELGILTDGGQTVTGAELSQLSDGDFESRISDISVYARVQPEHKVRIVNMWKKLGRITAMTGDGVNDAPALKSADIGVGMGITGTDVTKNVADMVLADDNFATIVCAVEEGRRIYDNIRKVIQFLLASNLSEVVSIFIATVLGLRLFAPIQILWINLITDTFPAMALGMEQAEPDTMQKPPRDISAGIFSGGLGVDIIWQGVIIGLLTLCSFFIGSADSNLTGMTMAFLTLSMCEIFHSLNMRSRRKSLLNMHSANRYLAGAAIFSFILTAAVIYVPGLNTVFKLTALSGMSFLISVGIAISIIPIVEIVKAIRRRGA